MVTVGKAEVVRQFIKLLTLVQLQLEKIMVKAYATLARVKGDPTGIQRLYQIYFHKPSPFRADWTGPFRDKTDAENAAEDQARRDGLELEWIEEWFM